MEKKTAKISMTVQSDLWKTFSENCYKAGMTPSRVIEVFMLCMIDPYPTERLTKFVTVADGLRNVIAKAMEDPPPKLEGANG